MTKAQFADRMKRSRSCVSNWIATGKISREALIGEGREALIWFERAKADLSERLDPSQQAIQLCPIDAVGEAAPLPMLHPEAPSSAAQERVAYQSDRERDLARRAKADADRAEHDAEAARRKLALDEGRYVLAEEAAAVWGREMSKHLAETEGFIGMTLPQLIAERHNLDWKILAAEMRGDYRDFRTKVSGDARSRREALEQENPHGEG